MPTPMLKSLAKKANVSIDKAEQAWFDAKKTADVRMERKNPQYWGLVTMLTKKALGINEALGVRSLKTWLKEHELDGMIGAAAGVPAEPPVICHTCNALIVANALFWIRDTAHSLHLNTKSYAQHMALGQLYEDVAEQMDRIIEAMQGHAGMFERIKPFRPDLLMEPADAFAFVSATYHWLAGPGRDLLPQEAAIVNMYDELVSAVLSAKYKLENLT